MALRNIIDKARQKIDERGGTEALKADAQELQRIAKGPGTASEKAQRAKDAIADPGARGDSAAGNGSAASGAGTAPPGSSRPTTEGGTEAGEQGGSRAAGRPR